VDPRCRRVASSQRDTKAAHRFFKRRMGITEAMAIEVTTDKAPVYPSVLVVEETGSGSR
jgi:hypothetical protein